MSEVLADHRVPLGGAQAVARALQILLHENLELIHALPRAAGTQVPVRGTHQDEIEGSPLLSTAC